MEPSRPVMEKEQKIKDLEQDLNDLRQGLTVVTDYYTDLETASKHQDASLVIDEEIIRPLIDDELEFESIWSFHEEVLVADPHAHVPCNAMYESFVRYCILNGKRVIGQAAFEFVFARMENPGPVYNHGEWVGFRLRTVQE